MNKDSVRHWSYRGVFGWSLLLFMPVMAVDMVLNDKLTRISEVGIVVVAVAGALLVRRDGLSAAFWAPPIVWLIAVETVGQIGVNWRIENAKTQVTFTAYALAGHAIWIGIASAAALVIVATRRLAQRS
jgi:hypothetical protein